MEFYFCFQCERSEHDAVVRLVDNLLRVYMVLLLLWRWLDGFEANSWNIYRWGLR